MRKNILISFSYISFFIVLGCSKSDHKATGTPGTTGTPQTTYILNACAYTFTDTTGVIHTFSDTVFYDPKYSFYFTSVEDYEHGHTVPPVAFLTPGLDTSLPQTFSFKQFNLIGYEPLSGINSDLSFSLPYFQASLSGPGNLRINLDLELRDLYNDVHYVATYPSPGVTPNTVSLAYFTTSTNISDSTGGFVSGSFNITATTVDSGKIKIIGQFLHMPVNYKS